MPQEQEIRNKVARMKLIPIHDLIRDRRIVFCEDSIVRGTQLRETVLRLYDYGAREVHMRPACPPLIHGCRFLNFSRSRSELDLAGRRAIRELERSDRVDLGPYSQIGSPQYAAMVDHVRKRLHLATLKYQTLGDLVESIGLPKDRLCTYCWDGIG